MFPAQELDAHLVLSRIPDELRISEDDPRVSNFTNLREYSDSTLSFLESNKVYGSKHSLICAAFQDVFVIFDKYYNQSSDDVFDLIKVEQSMHLIIDQSGTQDISTYLKLVEQNFQSPKIYELVSLLYRKHNLWSQGYSEQYEKWVHFMAPFLIFLAQNDFKFHQILETDADGSLLKQKISELNKRLAPNNVKIETNTATAVDLRTLQRELLAASNDFLVQDLSRNEDFYYTLGLFSFLHHILNQTIHKDYTFFQICVLATLYFKKIKSLTSLLGSLKLSFFSLEKISCSLTHIIPVLSTLNEKLTKKTDLINLQLLQALASVLFVLTRSEQDSPTFIKDNSHALSILLRNIVLDIFKPNQALLQKTDSPLYGKFLNFYQYFVWILLGFSSSLYAALPNDTYIRGAIYTNFLKEVNTKNLRPLVLEQYCDLVQSATLQSKNLLEAFSQRLTLSPEIDLEKTIVGDENQCSTPIELYLDLSRSLKTIFSMPSSLKKNMEIKTQVLFNTYLKKIPKAEPSDLDRLNHIGAFLLGLTSLESSSVIKQISKTFIEDFLIFLKIQPAVTKEALIFLEKDLWKTFSKSESLPHQDTTLFKIMAKYQDFSGQCGCALVESSELASLLKIKKIKQNLLTYLTDSFSQVNQNLQDLWDQFPIDDKFQRSLTIECNKLIFFLIPLFKALFASAHYQAALTDESQWHNFKNLIRQVTLLYFQPALVFLAKDYEKHYIYFQTTKALKESEKIKILALVNFAGILRNFSKQLRSQFPSSDPLQQKIWTDFVSSHIKFSEQSMTITNHPLDNQPKAMLVFYTFIFGLARMPDILSKINVSSIEHYQSLELTLEIKELLTNHLKPFLLQAASLFHPSLSACKQVFSKIVHGFCSVLRCPSNDPANDSLYIGFFTSLISSDIILTDSICCFICSCFDSMNTNLVKKISFLALADLDLWKVFFKQLSSFDLGKMSEFMEAILKRVENVGGFEEAVNVQPGSTRRKSFQIFIENLYNLLSQEIEDFPLPELLCLANKALNSTFARLLSVFETIFVYLQYRPSSNKSNNEYLNMLINKLQEAKNEQTDDAFLVAISQKFYSSLSRFVLFHPFEKIRNMDPKKTEEAQLVSFSTLKNYLIDYCHGKSEETFFKPFQSSKNPLVNKILTIQTYLGLLETLMLNSSLAVVEFDLDQSFINAICFTVTDLFNSYSKSNQGEEEASVDFSHLANFVSKMLLSSSAVNYFSDKISKEQTEMIIGFTKSLMTIPKHKDELLNSNLLGLLQIVTYLDRNSISIDDLRPILNNNNAQQWSIAFRNNLAFVLDILLENSLPNEMLYERELKERLGGLKIYSGVYNVENFNKEPSPSSFDHQTVSTFKLSTIFVDKFIISSKCPKGNDRFSPENLQISIDLTREPSNAKDAILNYLEKLSLNAQKTLDLLTDSLLDNYLSNMVQLSLPKDQPSNSVRETSGFISLLSSFLFKYRHLIPYVAFVERDYSFLFDKYGSSISIIKKASRNQFTSVTFLECLFSLKYLAFHAEELLPLTKVLCSSTGITFVTPQDPKNIVDISETIINKFINYLRKSIEELENSSHNSSCSAYFAHYNLARTFTFIWSNILQNYTEAESAKYFKKSILQTTNKIISFVKFSPKLYSEFLKLSDGFDSIFSSHLNHYYQKSKAKSTLTEETINKFKSDHYKDLLAPCDESSSNSENLNEGSLVQSININSEIINWYNETEECPVTRKEKIWRILQQGPTISSSFLFKIPITGQTVIANQDKFKDILKKKQDFTKYVSFLISKTSRGCETDSKVLANLRTHQRKIEIDELYHYPRALPPLMNIKSVSLLCPEKFKSTPPEQIFDSKLGQVISARIKCKNYQYVVKEQNPIAQNPIAQNLQPKMTIPQEIRKIKYFDNFKKKGMIKKRKQFNSIIRALRIELKTLTERFLVAQLLDPQNTPKEDLITELLLQQAKSLSESEGNLLFCLAEDFEILKCFKKSSLFEEIKEEFIWIQNNFELYLYSINNGSMMTQLPLTTQSDSHHQIMFFEGAPFCVDSSSTEPPPSSSLPKDLHEKIAFVKDIYFVDDQLVESMLDIFYLKHSPTIQPFKLLIEFCSSPLFEIKLLDFCFFFLYCSKHVSNCSDQNKIHNLEFSQSPSFVYQTVAENILEFLKIYLPSKEYLIYQPKIYLEDYGILRIKEAKAQFGFEKASQTAFSIFDLLVGLFTVHEISSSWRFKKALDELISSILSSSPKFENVAAAQTSLEEKPRMLSLKSLELLITHSNDTIKLFKQFPEIITHQFNRVLETLHQKVNLLYFKGLVSILQEVVQDKDKIIKALTSNQEYLSQLAELLEIISLHLIEKRQSLDQSLLDQLSKGIIEHKEVKTLVCYILETSTVIHKEVKNNKLVLSALLKIGLHFYTLSCLADTDQNDVRLTTYLEEVAKKYQENLIAIILESSSKDVYYKLLPLICIKIPSLFDLTFKRRIFKEQITKFFGNNYETREIIIDRKNLLKTTLTEFLYMPAKTLRQKIKVKFTSENGIDGGGLTREYLTIIAKELFNPQNGLFCYSENKVHIQPSPLSPIIPHHLIYFELAGVLLAKAIQHESVLNLNFSQSFLKQIQNKEITLDDIDDIDPHLAKNLRWLLENPVEELEQSFVYESHLLEQRIVKELICDGSQITLTEQNKKDFVTRICQMKLKEEISQQTTAFLRGFHLIIPCDLLAIFTSSELQLLISGPSIIDIEQLKQTAEYRAGYTQDSIQIIWLWEILNTFSQEELALFVLFISGSPKLPFTIENQHRFKYAKPGYAHYNLPVAHTCSLEIVLPEYNSKEELERKLRIAISEGQGSFMLS